MTTPDSAPAAAPAAATRGGGDGDGSHGYGINHPISLCLTSTPMDLLPKDVEHRCEETETSRSRVS
jgi:hypothetical protein